jgi:hypothetical protein
MYHTGAAALIFFILIKRYGDYTPKTDIGKVAVAAYAIAVVNVVAGLLKPGRMFLEDICRVQVKRRGLKPQEPILKAPTATSVKKEM